ncbi:hypothetical protein, partial [Escherichia coli]|uniref:hypothetical protein n=1 Tax=Escherichia coli TaxID=562 RepID=UPI001965534F
VGVDTGAQLGHVDRLVAFVLRRAAAAHPRSDRGHAGGDLQTVGGPAVGGQFDPGVFLLALLHVVERATFGLGVLVSLARLE